MRKSVRTASSILFVLAVACGGQQAANPADAPTSQPTETHETIIQAAETDTVEEPEATEVTDPGVGHHGEGPHDGADGGHHHRFDDPEAWAARWETPERDAWQQPAQVVEWMAIESGMNAADIGTGTGYFMPYLVDAVGPEGSVQCLDIESTMVDYVNERIANAGFGNALARVVLPDDPQLEPGTLDRVLVVNTWHHLADREAYAAKVFAGLAPGGTVTIVEYDMDAQPGPPVEMRLLPDQVITELESAGFAAEVVGTLEKQYVVRGSRP